MPSVGTATVPPTTIFALFRKPPSALGTGASHGTSGSAASHRRCFPASCVAYGSPMRVQERHRPASK